MVDEAPNAVEPPPVKPEPAVIVTLEFVNFELAIEPAIKAAVTDWPAVTVKSISELSTKLPAWNAAVLEPEAKCTEPVSTEIVFDITVRPFPVFAETSIVVTEPAVDKVVVSRPLPETLRVDPSPITNFPPFTADAVNE